MAAALLRAQVPDVELTLHETGHGIVNLVARMKGSAPGRRLVMNGHLDTYPINEALPWSVDPLGGVVRDGRIYGRGAADMKGGIAASMTALALLAEHRSLWRGEVVLALGGDEESMGLLGTQWLIENVPHASGDAVIIGDVGSPAVLRFGEKGFLWIEVEAVGTPAHGAHVHRGVNALDRLRRALDALASLRDMPVVAPSSVTRAIAEAQPMSEPLSGAGEADTLGRVTVNVGYIHGGTSLNLIPEAASAGVDVRLPVGVSGAEVGGAHRGDARPHGRHQLARAAAQRAELHRAGCRDRSHGGGCGARYPRCRPCGEHAGRRIGRAPVPRRRRADGRLWTNALQHGWSR